ncbi:hypothetical protein Pyn_24983 [Prunus yedoensis var. nudiflora]|uniref:Uncharacterized protein n=1 Tax=Prunus yedoensis var. nudiflora TaxID=2094558 RepID=A0A315A9E2_PRUYE|nr:hypothetical protein Pyn_24983 [Prunus yedoensis var. nudiflora]
MPSRASCSYRRALRTPIRSARLPPSCPPRASLTSTSPSTLSASVTAVTRAGEMLWGLAERRRSGSQSPTRRRFGFRSGGDRRRLFSHTGRPAALGSGSIGLGDLYAGEERELFS